MNDNLLNGLERLSREDDAVTRSFSNEDARTFKRRISVVFKVLE